VWAGRVRDHRFNNQNCRPRCCASADGTQDSRGVHIVPIMKYVHQQICIGDRQSIAKEVAGLSLQPGFRLRGFSNDVRLIEYDATRRRRSLQN
jgi:hypothetical protein